MTALVAVKRGLARLPARIPDAVSVLYVEITPAVVHRNAIVAIAGNAAELCILVERVTSRRVADQREEIIVAQVVDPRIWGRWSDGHEFPRGVVKISEF